MFCFFTKAKIVLESDSICNMNKPPATWHKILCLRWKIPTACTEENTTTIITSPLLDSHISLLGITVKIG